MIIENLFVKPLDTYEFNDIEEIDFAIDPVVNSYVQAIFAAAVGVTKNCLQDVPISLTNRFLPDICREINAARKFHQIEPLPYPLPAPQSSRATSLQEYLEGSAPYTPPPVTLADSLLSPPFSARVGPVITALQAVRGVPWALEVVAGDVRAPHWRVHSTLVHLSRPLHTAFVHAFSPTPTTAPAISSRVNALLPLPLDRSCPRASTNVRRALAALFPPWLLQGAEWAARDCAGGVAAAAHAVCLNNTTTGQRKRATEEDDLRAKVPSLMILENYWRENAQIHRANYWRMVWQGLVASVGEVTYSHITSDIRTKSLIVLDLQSMTNHELQIARNLLTTRSSDNLPTAYISPRHSPLPPPAYPLPSAPAGAHLVHGSQAPTRGQRRFISGVFSRITPAPAGAVGNVNGVPFLMHLNTPSFVNLVQAANALCVQTSPALLATACTRLSFCAGVPGRPAVRAGLVHWPFCVFETEHGLHVARAHIHESVVFAEPLAAPVAGENPTHILVVGDVVHVVAQKHGAPLILSFDTVKLVWDALPCPTVPIVDPGRAYPTPLGYRILQITNGNLEIIL